MKKIILLLIFIVAVAAVFFFLQREESPPGKPSSRPDSADNSPVVIYTDSGFTPKELDVRSGTTVIFRNESANPMWVASDPHPVHSTMPAFDSKKGLNEGETYSFTFLGPARYHNHLVPTHTGQIAIVE